MTRTELQQKLVEIAAEKLRAAEFEAEKLVKLDEINQLIVENAEKIKDVDLDREATELLLAEKKDLLSEKEIREIELDRARQILADIERAESLKEEFRVILVEQVVEQRRQQLEETKKIIINFKRELEKWENQEDTLNLTVEEKDLFDFFVKAEKTNKESHFTLIAGKEIALKNFGNGRQFDSIQDEVQELEDCVKEAEENLFAW